VSENENNEAEDAAMEVDAMGVDDLQELEEEVSLQFPEVNNINCIETCEHQHEDIGTPMTKCDTCLAWFHTKCIKLSE
jgi:hypothetical protein